MNIFGLLSNTTDPAFNLATEEMLLKHKSEDYLFLYTDSPSIIVGKHQNAYAETNFKVLNDRNLPLFRRMSGGGTVYHDSGNLNFSFITTGKPGMLVDFKGFTNMVIQALNEFGIKAYFGGRNDILIDQKKISGNASHVYKNRVMHHGTLLFNSDLSLLGDALKTDASKYKDKAVKSVRSLVTNISYHSPKTLRFNEFRDFIFSKIVTENEIYNLTENEIERITELVNTKYSKWNWNYGYSPDYSFTKRIKIQEIKLLFEITFSVRKGIIQNLNIKSTNQISMLIEIFSKLIDTEHEVSSITKLISNKLKKELGLQDPYKLIIQLF